MTMQTPEQVTEALEGISEALRLDGYDLQVTGVADTLDVRIVALDGACEDCLVPAGAMAQTISGALRGSFRPEQITIAYPDAAH
jgi:Fe-S cluster biogenesis protein NfuA